MGGGGAYPQHECLGTPHHVCVTLCMSRIPFPVHTYVQSHWQLLYVPMPPPLKHRQWQAMIASVLQCSTTSYISSVRVAVPVSKVSPESLGPDFHAEQPVPFRH